MKILIKKDALVDENRGGRTVPIKFYYPSEASAKMPLIVWSHGLGGGVDGANFLSRHFAENGFMVMHVQHPGTDISLWEGKDGHPWDIIRATHIPRSATLDRFADVPFVLDHLPDWMGQNSEIGDLIDVSRMGMSGHSFGALTTQVMAGQLFPDEDEALRSYKDARFMCGIAYSPVPAPHPFHDENPSALYGSIDIPL